MDALFEELEALVELVAVVLPLLVAHAEVLEPEGFGVPHLGAHLAPDGILAAVGKLDEIEGLLNVDFQFGVVERHILRRHILAGDAHTHDGQRLGAQTLAEEEVLVVTDAQRLTVVREGRSEVVLGAHAVHRPAVPVVTAALLLPHRLLPEVAVREIVPLDDAPPGEAHELGFQIAHELGKVAAEDALHRVVGHHGEAVHMDGARVGHAHLEGTPVEVDAALQMKFIAVPLAVGAEAHLLCDDGFPLVEHADDELLLIVIRTGVEGDGITHPLLKVDAVVCLVLDALARLLDGETQIVRVLGKEGAVPLHFERDALARRRPAVAAVVVDDIVVPLAVDVLCLEVSVLQHLGIEAAVEVVIEVLKKDPHALPCDEVLPFFADGDLHLFLAPCSRLISARAPKMRHGIPAPHLLYHPKASNARGF